MSDLNMRKIHKASTLLLLFHQVVNDKAIRQPLKPFYYYSLSLLQTNGITSQLSALSFSRSIYSANYYYGHKDH